MPDRHAQNPISIRPPKDDRAWLESYARQVGRPVRAVIVEAIARERARQEAGTMDITDADRRLVTRSRELADAHDMDALRVIAGGRPGVDGNMVRAEVLGVAQYLLGELASLIERLEAP
jgi:hypothetical protein